MVVMDQRKTCGLNWRSINYLWRNEIYYTKVLLLSVCLNRVVIFVTQKQLIDTLAEINWEYAGRLNSSETRRDLCSAHYAVNHPECTNRQF